jgi:hypothetical protein
LPWPTAFPFALPVSRPDAGAGIPSDDDATGVGSGADEVGGADVRFGATAGAESGTAAFDASVTEEAVASFVGAASASTGVAPESCGASWDDGEL